MPFSNQLKNLGVKLKPKLSMKTFYRNEEKRV